MSKIEEAQEILRMLGLPRAQQNEITALTLLALVNIGPEDPWQGATRQSMTLTKAIMRFILERYEKYYAPNTRETFRRQVLHQLVQARIADYNPDNPDLPTNSPRAHYAISEVALNAVRAFGTDDWQDAVTNFVSEQGSLITIYEGKRSAYLVPLRLPDDTEYQLSPGRHNELQVAIVQLFGPRFAPDAHLLYLGDTAKKMLILDQGRLQAIGVPVNEHSKLPDVVLYDEKRQWLFLIEAVTSHGPMTPKRIVELRVLLASCTAGCVYVSAFPDFAEFRKHLKDIAWETEIWIADVPEHLIHFNGDRFLGPR